jgi:hypothetical protein
MLTDKNKEQILYSLQQVLRIQDWNIKLQLLTNEEFCKKYEIDTEDTSCQYQGFSITHRETNQALIDINLISRDMYTTLIYELLHVTMNPFQQVVETQHLYLKPKEATALESMLISAEETVVEKLANVIAQLYPIEVFNDDTVAELLN